MDHSIIKPLYAELRKQLTSHFKTVQGLEDVAQSINSKEGEFLRKVNRYIIDHIDEEDLSVQLLSRHLEMSRSQFYRRIKRITRKSPIQYLRLVRLNHAKELLESKSYSVAEVAYHSGFASCSHFTRVFKAQYGFKPSDFKSK